MKELEPVRTEVVQPELPRQGVVFQPGEAELIQFDALHRIRQELKQIGKAM